MAGLRKCACCAVSNTRGAFDKSRDSEILESLWKFRVCDTGKQLCLYLCFLTVGNQNGFRVTSTKCVKNRHCLINMANIAGNNYKDKKILKWHKNFMWDRPPVRRPNNTGCIEFHAGQCPMSNTYFKPHPSKNHWINF